MDGTKTPQRPRFSDPKSSKEEKVHIHLPLKNNIIYVFKVQISLVENILCLFYFHILQADNGLPIN